MLGPQARLVDLSGRRERHGSYTHDGIREPPVGNSCSKRIEQGFIGDVGALSRLDDQYGALAPFVMRPTYHRDQRHLGQRADNGLDLTGVDPFAARFDEVLRPPVMLT